MDQGTLKAIIIRCRIKDIRREVDVTQEELAGRLGVSRQAIISVESGKSLPSIPLALSMARFFNIPIERLFELNANKNESSEGQKEVLMNRELSSFRGVSSLHDAIDRMFEDALSVPRQTASAQLFPQMNIYQTAKAIVVEADVPGMTEDDIDMEIRDGVLTIKGERKDEQEENEKEFFHREVSYGAFQRAITLPKDVIADHATAEVKKGQLIIILPKVEPVQPKVHKLKAKRAV